MQGEAVAARVPFTVCTTIVSMQVCKCSVKGSPEEASTLQLLERRKSFAEVRFFVCLFLALM